MGSGQGYLRVDRPQRTSSQPPTLYGFVPRTYKLVPGEPPAVTIEEVYGRAWAHRVVEASLADYQACYGAVA